ncbi:MAG: hypothetical protein ACUVRM_09385 [Bacillota bacterium]
MTRTPWRLSEFWRTSALVYREAIFQSIYVLKRGGRLTEEQLPGQLKQTLAMGMWITKALLCLFLAGIGVGAALAPPKVSVPGIPPAFGMAVVAGLLISTVLLMIAVISLDIVTGFIAAKTVPVLALLPLTKREIAAINLLGFLRIFDAPLLMGPITFGLFHFLFTRSLAGALTYMVGVATAEAFAVILALALAELFYSKVFNQKGAGIKNIVKMIYLLFTLMPGLGMFLIFNYQVQVGKAIVGILATRPELAEIFQLLYPLSFGFLVAAATGSHGATGRMLMVAGTASAVYLRLAGLGLAWAAARLRLRALGGNVAPVGRIKVKDFKVKPVAPWLGVLVKDMRIAFRSPSEAALLLMPAAAVIPWAITMGSQGKLLMTAPVLVVFVAVMSFMMVAALFNVEAVGQAFIRSLPVRHEWVLGAKTAVAATGYVISMLIVMAIAAFTGRGETGFLAARAVAGLPAMAAGALVVGAMLFRRTRRGSGRTSPFLTPGSYLVAIMAGILAVAGPLIAAAVASVAFGIDQLVLHFLLGLAEFAVVAARVLAC